MASTRFGLAPITFEDQLSGAFENYQDVISEKSWHPDTKKMNICMKHTAIEKDAIPNVTFTLQITQEMCNITGNLHGGCAATLIDDLTTVLLFAISQDGLYRLGGVSRNLSTTYFRPVAMGTKVRIVCEVVNAGKSLVRLRGGIYRIDTGQLCVQGDNEKTNSDAKVPSLL